MRLQSCLADLDADGCHQKRRAVTAFVTRTHLLPSRLQTHVEYLSTCPSEKFICCTLFYFTPAVTRREAQLAVAAKSNTSVEDHSDDTVPLCMH